MTYISPSFFHTRLTPSLPLSLFSVVTVATVATNAKTIYKSAYYTVAKNSQFVAKFGDVATKKQKIDIKNIFNIIKSYIKSRFTPYLLFFRQKHVLLKKPFLVMFNTSKLT